jgi:hypothetical protein
MSAKIAAADDLALVKLEDRASVTDTLSDANVKA